MKPDYATFNFLSHSSLINQFLNLIVIREKNLEEKEFLNPFDSADVSRI